MSGWVVFVALVAVIGCTAAAESRMWSNCGNRHIPSNGKEELNAFSRIVGGQEAKANSWGQQCSLVFYGSHQCGGSLIRNAAGVWFFVTAAHCTEGVRLIHFSARCGTHDRNQGKVITFNKLIEHEEYNSRTFDYDIAVLQVATPLEQSNKIWPICLPSRDVNDGEKGIVTGWGAIYQDGPISNKLLQVVVPVKPDNTCNQRYPFQITNRMYCAGYTNGQKDSCQADSGGGLNYLRNNKWELGGIVSWGYGCAQSYNPGVYANARVLLSWLEGKIRDIA